MQSPARILEEEMKTVALVMGLFIAAFGLVGLAMPSALVWVAHHAVTGGVFYVVAVFRIAFGLILVSVSRASRSPAVLRVLGCVIVVAGIATALTGLLAMERARSMVEWWCQQGDTLLRLTAILLVALGGFVAYACAPTRRPS